jgi:hypothetical protein
MRPLPRNLLLAALAVAALALAGRATADPPVQFKNLQVLPKNIAKEDLKATMKAQARALGVDCDHCHDMPDADKDTKNKKVARDMMKMTNEINQKFLKSATTHVTCETCHRGKEKPEATAPTGKG